MLPQGGTLRSGTMPAGRRQPGRTYRIDWQRGRISGMTDELEAVRQSVSKIVQTERFDHLIYSGNYGSEWRTLIGMGQVFAEADCRRRLEEAVLQDDRVTGVEEVSLQITGESMVLEATVRTIYGDVPIRQEVIGSG